MAQQNQNYRGQRQGGYQPSNKTGNSRRPGGNQGGQTRLTFTIGAPLVLANGNFEIGSYAVARKMDNSLVDDGHRIHYHADDLKEFYGETVNGRVDFNSEIPASRAGQKVTLTCHTIMDNKMFEKSVPIQIPSPKKVDIRLLASKPKPVGSKFMVEIEAMTIGENGKPISRPISFYDEWLKKLANGTTDATTGKFSYAHRSPLKNDGKTVVIRVQIDNTNMEKAISIEPPPASLKILPSANLEVFGGGEIQFQAKFELPVNISWHLIGFGLGTGSINANSGLYKAPEVIGSRKTIKIQAIDLNRPDNQAEVKIALLPVKMKIKKQRVIHAGEENVRLAIESHNDLNGLDNFYCEIISRPEIGEITADGLYTPPLVVDSLENIRVKATSKLDETKSVELEFEVDLPLCPACKGQTDNTGKCTVCKSPRSYGASL